MSMKRKQANADGGLVVVCSGEKWKKGEWGDVVNALKANGMSVETVSEQDKVSVVAEALTKASLFVCEEGWVQHVARSMGVRSVVVWNGGNPELEGWPEQDNLRGDRVRSDYVVSWITGRR